MANFLRTASSSSLTSIGSDNLDVVGRGGKNTLVEASKNKTMIQRTRDALGDIGNRLKKNPSVLGGKAGPLAKREGVTKEFPVPLNRPPRAAALKPKTQLGVKKEVSQAKPLKPDPVASAASVDVVDKHLAPAAPVDLSKKVIENDKENATEEKKELVADSETAEIAENEYNPKLSSEASNAVETFSSDRLNVIVDIDKDEWNPLLVQVYIKEIYDYVFALEKKYRIRVRYLEGRLVNSRMRAVLLDWLVEVHAQFSFMPETLYMAAKILDLYLQADRSVTRKQLQLVGVTAMYVAAKYEEVCTPAVQDFAAVCDNAFSVSDVIKMEQSILNTLSFDLAFPPAVLFLRRFSKAASATMHIHSMAKYIMELSVIDYAAVHLLPSERAAGSLALALVILEDKKISEVWSPTVQHYTRYSFEAIKPTVSILAGVLARAYDETQKLKAVYKKYNSKRLSHISTQPQILAGNWKKRVLLEVCKI